MAEKEITVLAPAPGAYVPPQMRLDALSLGDSPAAVMNKDKGKSTDTYLPPHKANAAKFTSGSAAPASEAPKKTDGTWGPSSTPQVPAAPLEDLKVGSVSPKRTAGTWGPSKSPQVPAAPLKDLGEWSGSSSPKATELSAPEKTSGVCGPSKTLPVPAVLTKDSHTSYSSSSRFESIAHIWNSPTGTQESPSNGSGNGARKSIYSLQLSSEPIPTTCPLLKVDWGYIGQPLFDPRAERNAERDTVVASGSFQYSAGSTTAVARPSPGARSRAASISQTARSSPSERSPVSTAATTSTTSTTSRASVSSAHTSPAPSGSWMNYTPSGSIRGNVRRNAAADGHAGYGALSDNADNTNSGLERSYPAARFTAALLTEWERQRRINNFGAMPVSRRCFTGPEHDPIYTEEEIEAMDHNTRVAAEAAHAVVADGNGLHYRYKMASRYQGVANRLYMHPASTIPVSYPQDVDCSAHGLWNSPV